MTNNITIDKKYAKLIANETLNWCINKFGNPLKTCSPILKVSYNRAIKNRYGVYFERVIEVYPLVCENEKTMVRAIIHEFRHFLQMPKLRDMSKYYKLSETHNYSEHPLEIDAFDFEKKNYQKCLRYLKRKKLI